MKCPQCPVAAALACLGEVAPPLCRDVANGKRGRAEQLVAKSEGRPMAFDWAAHDALKTLVLGCDYRGPNVQECGCTKTKVCLAGKGRPIPGTDARDVTDADCRACVTGGLP